jgi:hypothetical protein
MPGDLCPDFQFRKKSQAMGECALSELSRPSAILLNLSGDGEASRVSHALRSRDA